MWVLVAPGPCRTSPSRRGRGEMAGDSSAKRVQIRRGGTVGSYDHSDSRQLQAQLDRLQRAIAQSERRQREQLRAGGLPPELWMDRKLRKKLRRELYRDLKRERRAGGALPSGLVLSGFGSWLGFL